MSFWQSSSQPDLSVTGTSTSRHQRPPSGRRVRPSSAGRGGSTKSHIFGISDTPRQDTPKQKAGNSFHDNSTASSTVHTTPEAPRSLTGNQPKKKTGPVSAYNVRRPINISQLLTESAPNPKYYFRKNANFKLFQKRLNIFLQHLKFFRATV